MIQCFLCGESSRIYWPLGCCGPNNPICDACVRSLGDNEQCAYCPYCCKCIVVLKTAYGKYDVKSGQSLRM